MIDYEKIEQYVDDLLNLSGVGNGEGERPVRFLLHHLYCAVATFELMEREQKALVKGVQRRLKYFFSTNVNLRERKRKTEREILPPTPLSIEKENKEKEESATHTAGREFSVPFSDSDVRRNAFRNEVWARRDKYEVQMLADFFNYWSDENPTTHRMRFEEQRYWNIDCRLSRWKSNSHTASDAVAAIKVRKAKEKQTQAQTAAEQAQEAREVREQENAEREAKAEKSRQTQMLTDEYVKAHPDSLMAKIYKKTKT